MEAAHEVLFNADLLLNHVTPHLSLADFGRLRMTCKELMDIVDGRASQWQMQSGLGGYSGYTYKATYYVVAPLRATMEISVYRIAGQLQRFIWVYFVHGYITWAIDIMYSSVIVFTLRRNRWHCTMPQWMITMCRRAAEVAWTESDRMWDAVCPAE